MAETRALRDAGKTIVGIVASPAFLLYENWFSYAYPSAACNVIAAYCLVRYLRPERWGYGAGCFTAAAALVLVNSTYQIEWLVVPLVVVCVVLRHRWRRAVVVAAVPLLVVVGWYVKDLAMFGTTTTSSWLGMNLARMVLFRAPRPRSDSSSDRERSTGLHPSRRSVHPTSMCPAMPGSATQACRCSTR